MDLGYDEYMDKKDAEGRPAAFGPTPVKKVSKPHEAKWRTNKVLYEKVLAIAAVQACKAELESGVESEVSFNMQLTFIAQEFVLTYEEKFGNLPKPDDALAVKKYAQAALKK